MNKRQKIIVSIVGITIVLLALLGITYAYYLTRIQGNTNTNSINITTAKLELVYGDGNGEIIEGDGALVPDSDNPIGTKTFTVTNNGNDSEYTVIIDNVRITKVSDGTTTSFVSNDFRYTLTCTITSTDETRNGTNCNNVLEQKLFPINGGVMVSNAIDEGDIHNYKLTLWYIDTGIDQSDDMGKSYKARVNIADITTTNPYKTGVTETDEKSLAYNIINNAKLNKNGTTLVNSPLTTPVVEASDENEKVLATTQDNYGTTYYFRGSVQDNYVLFNNMCFRIVRIEGDGSVKLTLAGEVESGATDCTGVTDTSALINDGASVTYGYKTITGLDGNTWYIADYVNDGKTPTNTTGNSQTSLKESLDTWFDSKFKSNGNLTSSGQLIKDETWCLGGRYDYKYHVSTGTLLDDAGLQEIYDLTLEDEGRGYYFWRYPAGNRLFMSKKTDLTCGIDEDKLISKVGALTSDEVTLTGGYRYSNETYYLRDNAMNKTYWTLSLAEFNSNQDLILYAGTYDGTISLIEVNYDGFLGSRPVITLVTGTEISGGEGTIDKPYVIAVTNIEDENNYVVELSTNYVEGKDLIVVYTNSNNYSFNYDGTTLRDISDSTYKYNNATEYTYMYGIVVDHISDNLADYESKITYEEGGVSEKVDFSTQYDLNFSNSLNVQDITTCYGTINKNESLYADTKYLKHILKSDVNFDKKATEEDCALVEAAAYPTE